MAKRWSLRHSPVGWLARKALHLTFRARHPQGKPVLYHLPGSVDIRLHPEGEIAEFLSFPWLFESQELQLVSAFLKPGMRMVDVGANIGLYSILANAKVGEGGFIWAFEPSQESYARLLLNLELNQCTRVRPIQVALGDITDGISTLATDSGYGDAYRYLLPASTHSGKQPAGELVRATTLDACAVAYGLDRIDFLKMDVEGGEYRVLLGARQTLAKNQNITILFECEADWCQRAGCTQQDVFQLVRSAGFQLYAWDKSQKNWISEEQDLLAAGMVWASRHGPPIPLPTGRAADAGR